MNKVAVLKTTNYGECDVCIGKYPYAPDEIAVILTNCGEHISTLSICSVDFLMPKTLEKGEFIAKTYSENEQIAKDAMESGLFEETGKFVQTGWVQSPIWKFVDVEVLNESY